MRDEYCRSLDQKITAWKNNVEILMALAEKLPGKDPEADARHRENLRELVQGLANLRKMLREHCMN